MNSVSEEQKFEIDPWPPAQEALFNVVRVWVTNEDTQVAAEECFKIMREVNETPGAPFIFVAELARVLAETVARHLADLNGVFPSREEVMAELEIIEMEYIEESVLAEIEDEDDETTTGNS